MEKPTKSDLVMLTRGHIVILGDDGKITVLERVSHRVVYYGYPSGDHPISASVRRIYELAAAQQLPEHFPTWDPYPCDRPTVETFAVYEVPAGVLPSRDVVVYFRDVMRRVKGQSKARKRKKQN